MSLFVRVEYKNERRFIEIENMESLTAQNFPALVVKEFQIQNAKGKKVYIHDQYDTRVYQTAELKFLLQNPLQTLILKVNFEQTTGRRSVNHNFTTKVKYLSVIHLLLSSLYYLLFLDRMSYMLKSLPYRILKIIWKREEQEHLQTIARPKIFRKKTSVLFRI